MKSIRPCAMVLLALAILVRSTSAAEAMAPDENEFWVDPHAWRDQTATVSAPSRSGCPPCPVATVDPPPTTSPERCYGDFVYRKLVNLLINEHRMRIDAVSGELHRTVHIRLTREQYDQIRAPERDLRKTDAWLQDVWQQSRPSAVESTLDSLSAWSERVLLFWHGDVLANRWLVTGLQALAGLAVLLLARRHRIGLGMLATGFVAFSVYRYLDAECHRRLEIERMADLMLNADAAQRSNPCDEQASLSWWRLFSEQLLGGNRRDQCVKYLASRYEKQCDIRSLHEVFMQTFVYGSMEGFFGALLGMTANIKSQFGYIGMLVVTALIFLNMSTIITAVFRYVIGPMLARGFGGGRRSDDDRPRRSDRGRVETLPEADGDRLSADNVDRLLSITESNTRLVTAMAETFRAQCLISGVQTIEDAVPSRIGASEAIKCAGPDAEPGASDSRELAKVEAVGPNGNAADDEAAHSKTD